MSYRAPQINGSGFLTSRTRILPVSGPRRWDTVGVDQTPTSGMGALTIPDYTIWSSGDISTFYNSILNAVSQLDQDINANVPNSGAGAQLRQEYAPFKTSFLAHWQTYHDAWPSGSSATPVTTAREDAGRYNAFEQRYTAITGQQPRASGIAPVDQTHPDRLLFGQPMWVWGVVGAGGIVVLGLGAWMISSVGRTARAFSPAALLNNPRSRRRRARRRRQRTR